MLLGGLEAVMFVSALSVFSLSDVCCCMGGCGVGKPVLCLWACKWICRTGWTGGRHCTL